LKYSELLQKYCIHQEYNFEEYKEFLKNNVETKNILSSQNQETKNILSLQNHEIFKEYKTQFEKESSTKALKNTRNFKSLTKEEQEKELTKEFIKYSKNIEKEKLFYF
jgi:hypothetical protein